MTFRVTRFKQSRNKAWNFLHDVKITLLAPYDYAYVCLRNIYIRAHEGAFAD